MAPPTMTHGSEPPVERDPLVALRQGDPAPFEEFVRARVRTLMAYFTQQGASLTRAEDLTQELFLRLYRSAARYRAEERLVAYCFRLARNLWIDECRRAPRHGPVGRPGPEVEELAAQEIRGTLLLEEEERGLRELLASLPGGQRRVLELALLGELSQAEIADQLSIPLGTVKSRMFHALRRLRAAWTGRRAREGVA